MNTEQENNTNDNSYHVVSVEKVDPPDGMPEGDWYRYVIGQGRSHIEGVRLGSLKTVRQHAENFAENLNDRTAKGYSAYAVRKQKK